MRYLVISPCEDVRNGKEFDAGDEFLPEPDPKQAKRLIAARCIEEMPDSAPVLPGTNPADAKVAALETDNADLRRTVDDLRGKLAKAAIDAGADASKAKTEIDRIAADRDALKIKLTSATAKIAELEKSAKSASGKEQGSAPAETAVAKDKAGA